MAAFRKTAVLVLLCVLGAFGPCWGEAIKGGVTKYRYQTNYIRMNGQARYAAPQASDLMSASPCGEAIRRLGKQAGLGPDLSVSYLYMPGSRNTPDLYLALFNRRDARHWFFDLNCELIGYSTQDGSSYPYRETRFQYPSG